MWWAVAAIVAWVLLTRQGGVDGSGHVSTWVNQGDLGTPSYSPYEPAAAMPAANAPRIGTPIAIAAPSGGQPGGIAPAAALPLVKTAVGIFAGGGAAAAGGVGSGAVVGSTAAADTVLAGGAAPAAELGAGALSGLAVAGLVAGAFGAVVEGIHLLCPTCGHTDPRIVAAEAQVRAQYASKPGAFTTGYGPEYVALCEADAYGSTTDASGLPCSRWLYPQIAPPPLDPGSRER